MWIFLNNSFLSIVAHRDKPDRLLVRARRAGDIKAVFPSADTWEDSRADYRFRSEIAREAVSAALSTAATEINYPNFKASVKDRELHDAYLTVWGVMGRLKDG
jgi:hypothetical protein